LVWKSLRALVSGVRSAATSPKVAKFAFSTVMKLYQSQGQSLQLPPSFRFPPLREGNRVGRVGSVPPACRGNPKEGVIGHTRFCELWLCDWYYSSTPETRRRCAVCILQPYLSLHCVVRHLMVNSCPSSLNRDSLAWNRDSSSVNRDSSRLDKFLPLPPCELIARHFLKTPSVRFPLQAGGTEGAWFPSRRGGNLQEGAKRTQTNTRSRSGTAPPAGRRRLLCRPS
jgi:hypothetical protein